jgi:tetratricopeptide (TPR) repeat protein
MTDTPRIEELRRRVLMDPASIAFAALAEEYRKQGRFDEAIETCTAGLQRHPAYLSAHVTLGRALLEVGRFDEAREELEHVLRVAPENLAAIRGLAEIHHRKGELPEVHAPFTDEGPPASPDTDRAVAPAIGSAPPVRVSAAPDLVITPPAGRAAGAPAAPHPALAPLEAFLAAIVAARGDRPSPR